MLWGQLSGQMELTALPLCADQALVEAGDPTSMLCFVLRCSCMIHMGLIEFLGYLWCCELLLI